MYDEDTRPSAETRLTTFTICDDRERMAAWRLLDGPGSGVRLDIGKGVLLERLEGEPRVKSCLLWADLKGVESADGVMARIQAVLQLAGRDGRNRAAGRWRAHYVGSELLDGGVVVVPVFERDGRRIHGDVL